ncbi:MAG: pentapeptide repeat-containing protein, partial [Dolichospermum sp.]
MPPDYSGQNLRGRSFKGQNLTGANFSKADIRGVDFTNANLKGADFTGAKAGLQRRWVIGLLIITLLLSALSGFLSIFIGIFIAYIFGTKSSEIFIIGTFALVMVTVFCIVTIRKGLIVGVFAGVFAGAFAVAISIAITIILVAALSGSVAFAIAGERSRTISLFFGVAGAFIGVAAKSFTQTLAIVKTGAVAIFVAIAVAVAAIFVIFNAYIGWCSFTGDEKDAWIRSFAIAFATTGGTSFHGADLTDADFTGATLKNTDFRKANLTRTRFY